MKIQPSRDDFKAHAAEHSIVPVWSEVLGDLETPVAAFVKLVGDEPGFLLESVEHGERWSRFSFVGRNPSATMVLCDGQLTVSGELPDSIPTARRCASVILAASDTRTPTTRFAPTSRCAKGTWSRLDIATVVLARLDLIDAHVAILVHPVPSFPTHQGWPPARSMSRPSR